MKKKGTRVFCSTAESVWVAFLREIYHSVQKDDSLARYCRDYLPIPTYRRERQLCRVQDWLEGRSVPSAAIGAALMRLSYAHGALSEAGLKRIFTLPIEEPKKKIQKPRYLP